MQCRQNMRDVCWPRMIGTARFSPSFAQAHRGCFHIPPTTRSRRQASAALALQQLLCYRVSSILTTNILPIACLDSMTYMLCA